MSWSPPAMPPICCWAGTAPAHVPDINDFVGGLKAALKPAGDHHGIPHRLTVSPQSVDTIYHEHFSFCRCWRWSAFSRPPRPGAVRRARTAHPMAGSLRILAQHANGPHATQPGLQRCATKSGRRPGRAASTPALPPRPTKPSARCACSLIDAKEQGLRVAGYGAGEGQYPAELLRRAHRPDRLHLLDASPHKQGTAAARHPHSGVRPGETARSQARCPRRSCRGPG